MASAVATESSWRAPGRAVGLWLLSLAAIVLGMVTLGGLTRLTGSGLSITEWQPVTGAVPPLTDAAWVTEFAKYQRIPQFVRENSWMTLSDFKAIYWWEWAHRFLGRLLAVAFAVPFAWFAWTGAIARRDWPRMLTLFLLGGLQGLVGWWMVESGLESRVSVSQYRLAIHLGTAVLLLGALLWIGLEYLRGPHSAASALSESRSGGAARSDADTDRVDDASVLIAPDVSGWKDSPDFIEGLSPETLRTSTSPQGGGRIAQRKRWAFGFVGLVYAQMLMGALVAGLHAGLVYNTWPTMDGRIFPEGAFFASPWWINFFENAGVAQFDHRVGAYIVAASAVGLWFSLRGISARVRKSSTAVLHTTLLQVALGIATLLLQAPLALSAAHQLVAALLFCAATWNAFEVRSASYAAMA
jgi:cytochrome c oxidase assembly protein subunit 15